MRIRKVKTNKQTRNRQRTHDEEAGAEEDGLHLDVQIDGEVDAEVVRIGEGLAHETGPLLRHFAHLRGAVGRVHLPPPSPPPPQKKYQKHERFHGESRWPKQKKNKKEKPAKTASSASPVERWFPTLGRDPPEGSFLGRRAFGWPWHLPFGNISFANKQLLKSNIRPLPVLFCTGL